MKNAPKYPLLENRDTPDTPQISIKAFEENLNNIKVAYLAQADAEDGFLDSLNTDQTNLGQIPKLILHHPKVETMDISVFAYRFNADPIEPISDLGYIYFYSE